MCLLKVDMIKFVSPLLLLIILAQSGSLTTYITFADRKRGLQPGDSNYQVGPNRTKSDIHITKSELIPIPIFVPNDYEAGYSSA